MRRDSVKFPQYVINLQASGQGALTGPRRSVSGQVYGRIAGNRSFLTLLRVAPARGKLWAILAVSGRLTVQEQLSE